MSSSSFAAVKKANSNTGSMKEGFISLRSSSDTDDATVLAAGFNKGLHHMLILLNLKTLGPQVYLMMIKMT